ncbi:pentatricopeptide repeat-containing protein At5g56310-like [Silene latifolia]|uniref:pentatricopeptide repeat-containing protein At5g56310-like n=1 Tax=Silene latifolia TaxID=37657 RepID=UPI003D770B10
MYDILISKLRRCCSLKHINQLHGFLIITGFFNDNFILSKFIETCSRIGFSHYGHVVFRHKYKPTIYLYNTIIKSLSLQQSCAKESILLFNAIRVAGLLPDSYSFPFVLRAVNRVLDGNVGRQVHGQVITSGFQENVHVAIALVQVYSSCGYLQDARQVFDEMSRFSYVALSNAMIAGYAGVGDMDSARQIFQSMTEKNVISWTSLIAGYVHVKRPEEAIAIFHMIKGEEDVELDEVALLATLSACADLGALELGQWIHGFIHQRNMRMTVPLCNALVDMYVKSGNIQKALQVFESMPCKTVVSWTTMIVGLAFHGLGREALEIFSRMERAGTRPNDISFIGILSACSHVGLVELGRTYFNSMSSKYGITPKIQHYGCMIDLLGRGGFLQEAEDLVSRMPFNANAAIWGSLLACARTQGDSSLAAKALQHLSILEPHNSGNYTLVSNTYAANGEWSEARLVRKRMRSLDVKKLPGGSSIELNGCIHKFVSGSVPNNAEAKEIHEILREINRQCKMEGCGQKKEDPSF